jgi:hypothetical protein
MLNDCIKPDEGPIVCPNQDVVYRGGFTALDKEPTVFQVPDFGNRYWVYPLYDTRTDEIARLGKRYGTKPGFYMIVGQNWKGKVPAGIVKQAEKETTMTTIHRQSILATPVLGALAFTSAHAQQVPISKTAAEVRGPSVSRKGVGRSSDTRRW